MNEKTAGQINVRSRPGVLAAFAGVSCFLALIQAGTLAAGVARLAFNRPLAVVILAVSVGLSVIFATRFFEPAPEQNAGKTRSGLFARAFGGVASVAGAGAVAWSAWVWYRCWILASLRPPYDCDGLYYHLPAIHDWVAAGRVSWIGHTPDIPFVNYPMGVELTTFFSYFLLDTNRLVNACNLWYWPLAFFAVAVIARSLGVRGVWAWAAGGLVVVSPVIVCQSVSCYIDPGFCAAAMAGIAAACVFVFDRTRRSRWWSAVLLGVTAGLALGSKGTGLPFAVVLVVFAVAGVLWVRGVSWWRRRMAQAGMIALVMVLVGGYWYIRNGINSGNPAYPVQLKIGAKVIAEGWDHKTFLDDNVPAWLEQYPAPLRMFVSWAQLDSPISGFAPAGGMGYIWLYGAVPAILLLCGLLLSRRFPGPGRVFVFLLALTLCLLVIQPASWWSRFTVWLHALGLPCIALVIYRAATARRAWWRMAGAVMAVAVVAVVVWESNRTLGIEWKEGRLAQPTDTGAEYMSSLHYTFGALEEIPGFAAFLVSRNIARSYWERNGTQLGGILAMPLDRRDIHVLPLWPDPSDMDALRTSGVEWIIWDAMVVEPPEIVAAAASESYRFNPVDDVDFRIFRIRSDSP